MHSRVGLLESGCCGQDMIFFFFKVVFYNRRKENISNKSFKEFSLVFISKTFQSVHGEVCLLNRLHSGDLQVEVIPADRSQLLTDSSAIFFFSVYFQVHPTMISIRGVIS